MRKAWICLIFASSLALASDSGLVRDFKTDYSGHALSLAPGTPIAGWNFETAVGNYANDYGSASVTMTNNGAATLISGDGTYPAGLSGTAGKAWEFDGTNDYLNRSDDGTFDPTDLLVFAVVTPYTVAAGEDCIAAKYETTANQKGWKLCRSADDIVLTLSADGNATTTLTKATCLAAYRPAIITATYDEGTTTAEIYVDNLATATSGAMSASIYDNTADFEIGASDTGGTPWEGMIHHLLVYDAYGTEATHDAMVEQWQGRLSMSKRTIAITSASPSAYQMPASTKEPFIIDQPPNTAYVGSPASGSGGIFHSGSMTNLPYRTAICETKVGNDPGGWGITENAGDGTAALDCSSAVDGTAVRAYGTDSVKMVLTGTTSYAQALANACMTSGIASDLYMSIRIKCTSGTCDSRIKIIEYGFADCSGGSIATTTIYQGNPGTSWIRKGGLFAAGSWNGATLGWRMMLQEAGDGGVTSYWDCPQARSASTPTDAFCGVDADASAVCNNITASIDNNDLLTVGSWTVEGTWRSPVDGADTTAKQIFHVPATAGNSNQIDVTHDSDTLTCTVNDSGGVASTSTVAAASNADEDWDWRIYHTDQGYVGCCAKISSSATWTCDATEAAGADMDGVSTTAYIGNTAGTGSDLWINNVRFFRKAKRL